MVAALASDVNQRLGESMCAVNPGGIFSFRAPGSEGIPHISGLSGARSVRLQRARHRRSAARSRARRFTRGRCRHSAPQHERREEAQKRYHMGGHSGDVLARDISLSEPSKGHVLAVLRAGVYTLCLANKYNARACPGRHYHRRLRPLRSAPRHTVRPEP